MRRQSALLLYLVASLLLPRTTSAADDAKAELERLQGDWIVTAAEINGAAIAEADLQDVRRTVKGEEISWIRAGETILRTRFAIDPSHQPKHWDVTFLDSALQGETHLGIYELKDDELKICVAGPNGERPSQFATKPDSGEMLFVLKKVSAPK